MKLDEYLDSANKNMIYGLNETLIQKERMDNLSKPRHSKKEYQSIDKLGVKGVFDLDMTEVKKIEFTDDKISYKDRVKL